MQPWPNPYTFLHTAGKPPQRLLILEVQPLETSSPDGTPGVPIGTDPNRLVVVHAGREEVRICNGAIGKPPGNLFDVQIAAGLVGLGYPLGYGPLVQSVLRKKLTKGATLTDWRRRPLSHG